MLENVLNNENVNAFAGCLAPPKSYCVQCGSVLQKSNKLTSITLYTISGPLPLKKVELRCRHCKMNYGITKYGNPDAGYQYYDCVGPVAEASHLKGELSYYRAKKVHIMSLS